MRTTAMILSDPYEPSAGARESPYMPNRWPERIEKVGATQEG
jgi:hypothetical protein